jgi:hypothetical protein
MRPRLVGINRFLAGMKVEPGKSEQRSPSC